jgi:hypothetical protein
MLTNIITTYTCEICGTCYENKQAAELCENSGVPSNKGKFIGKYLIAPTQVLINHDTDASSRVDWKIKWNIIRIDLEYVKPLAPASVRNTLMNLHKFGHRLMYKGLNFYPQSYVFDSLLDKAVEIPSSACESLLQRYISAHSKRDSMSKEVFQKYLYETFEKIIAQTVHEMNLNLNDSDFDNYSLEGLNNVSSQIINR